MSASGRGEDPLVRYEVRGAVAVLTLNRPERHNAQFAPLPERSRQQPS